MLHVVQMLSLAVPGEGGSWEASAGPVSFACAACFCASTCCACSRCLQHVVESELASLLQAVHRHKQWQRQHLV